MSGKLDSAAILRLMREERSKQLAALREELDVDVKIDGEEKRVISPGFKVRAEKDGLLYTVHAVGPDSVVLRDAEGNTFAVPDKEFEKGYRRD